MSDEVILRVNGLSADREARRVLFRVSFSVRRGEAVTIVGPNQAGKSTLLLSVMGLVRLVEGFVELRGERISGLSATDIVQRGVAFSPEAGELFSSMTVRENLELGSIFRKSAGETSARLQRVYALFPILKERVGQRAQALSGGEQQMLSIGRALMSSPLLLILDEPMRGLAPAISATLRQALDDLTNEGLTILIAEQLGCELGLRAARRLWLADGRLSSPNEETV